ncbi:MAG TPA: secretin and TonB N-terminal domain-containing protein [Tepidisphaeraceae bacterium]
MKKTLYAAAVLLGTTSAFAGEPSSTPPPGQAKAPTSSQPADPFESAEVIPVVAAEGKTVRTGDVKFDEAQGTVEIHVNDANVVEVLRMLSAQSQKNIIASKDVKGTVTANLYGVTVKEALDAILASNGYAYRERGNFIFVYTVGELREIERASRSLRTEVFRVFYTPAANAVNMIKPVLSPDAQVSFTTPAQSGINSGTGDVGGNSHAIEDMMVITDYAENIEAVKRVLKEVDRRPQQIMIEATILRASLSEDNALGVDFNLLAGVKLNNVIHNNSGQITNANTNEGGTVGGGNARSMGTGNAFSSSVPGGLKVGFVSDSVSVFLSALEGVTDTVVMANPKILALNKQKGEVIVGRKDGYLTTTVTESSTVQTVEFLDTGTRLVFRPYIGDDGYVRMEIHPEDSSGGLTGANLPFKITTEVTSNIMVKDGHTVVIGGLFREASESNKSQVPILGNLPGVGNLFGQQRDRMLREEIIILLTPHVIKDDVAFSAAAEQMAQDGERLRVGVRRGMMPWGRQRLAEMSYEWAQDEMKKPSPDHGRMLWHLDCATNLNPNFLEAIKLKEQLSGQTLSETDGSSMRGFLRRQVMSDQVRGLAAPVQPRSTPIERSEVPATQPVDAGTTQPATDQPADQPVNEANTLVMPPAQSADATFEAPTTQPTPKTTVTVLPDEPLEP